MNTLHIPTDAASEDRFVFAVEMIDHANEGDPRTIVIEGAEVPYEWGYSRRLTHWALQREPESSERVLLAARAQHLKRWALPRSDFPEGLNGYLEWRERLKSFHAAEVEPLLRRAGYEDSEIESVQRLIRKEGFPKDPDTRVVEDALCLVFLDLQLAVFMEKHPEEKVIEIIQKTWGKMSTEGKALALKTAWDPVAQALVEEALSSSN
jgi:hypothetical protein